MLHSTNIRMLQKHSKVATFEGSFESDTFVYALIVIFNIVNQEWQMCKFK